MQLPLFQEYEKKDKQLNFRVSETEYLHLHNLCKTHGISVTTFIREAMNYYAVKHYSDSYKEQLTA
jgi:predicted DNA binding CopG/RHH family protein